MEFVHLHNHSDYSLLDGAARIPKYVEMAQEMGMKHLGLTDHGNLFGALRFEQACHGAGINPVVGCEVYVSPTTRQEKQTSGYKNFHMVLYCKNEEGYRNLMILVSKGFIEGFYYKPRIDDDLLRAHHEGLICSTACLGGEIPRYLVAGDYEKARDKAVEYNELFGEGNFYLEIMDHDIPEEKIVIEGIKKIHAETGIPIIATNDIHYLKKEHARAQDILVCIGTGKKMDDEKRFKMDKTEMYFKTPEQMHEMFGNIPGALENTVRLAEKCDLIIPQPGPILPEYVIPENFETQAQYLTHLTWEGIKERYNEVTDEITKRVEYELDILLGMGFEGYFLIVWDFIHWARVHDIPVGPGRGSGAGSIIAYAMKITDIDPLKYDLLFERFLNPERVSMPDFDIDFCFERRGEVIEYVNRKYGHDQVGGICTFGTLKTKAVLKDVARVLDIPFAESNVITKLIPEGKAPDGRKINTEVALEIEPKLKEFYDRGGAYKELFETASVLEGMNRHISTHACGKVIGNSVLTDYVPLYKDQKTGEITTEFTMDIIEPCGLVKMDFLGLKTLTLLKNVEGLVQKIDPDFDVNTVSEEDKSTFDMLSNGKSTAVFQFESSGMQKILKDAKPNNIEDLIALNALYRPGPLQFIPQFIEGKKNPRTIKFPDPSLEELLTPTYGVIVYQEQVMKVAQIIGGFSLGKADILRRAMGKKKLKDMEKMKVEFIAGAKKIGHAEKHASGIFDMLEPFAGYGFNKSHAAAYSVVAYKTAYCKANHPAEFWAANLTNEISDTTKMTEYMESARDEGIEILAPDINYSEKFFNVVDNKVFYGLIGIKGMGSAAVDVMIAEREANGLYESFMDFLERVDLRSVNKKVLEVGIQSGLFDKIESSNRATLLHNLEKMLDHVNSIKEQSQFGQVSLFGDNQDEITPVLTLEVVPDWENKEILQIEKDNLGFYFSGHPLDEFRTYWNKCTNLKLDKAFRASSEKDYTIMGMIKGVRSLMTKKGSKMAFATVEDFNGSIDLVLFSKTYEKYAHLLEEDKVLGFTGQVDLSRNEPSFKVKEMFVPEDMREIQSSEIHIELEERDFLTDELVDFRSFLQDRGGSSSVFLHLKRPSKKFVVKISGQISISPAPAVLKEIGRYPIVSNVWKE
ncbi:MULTISPECIES: DNA polymerase III subunit alpha [unclassified Oceanispirochaeta]|uniref:DNA polymerase III subunit alpha n=1 Tax=unclassified Oceanispirochaeta TaxID=2635722 RepID=UPI000E097BFA|nr:MULTISPECIES: DNA polymerase III subunit alpha [unclassified Oceanispirochaeta]MBF9015715.1 DNA polymerase III subunit alpha [Oceanispirochaeta sp. M2]NPD72180.1 DNA polymerase III subunit alpha [Oceanispirochaeta sp. M1]RDG32279.1 DNA polymerase III subunit alpha [Oceanispirochaeta sp. M1]